MSSRSGRWSALRGPGNRGECSERGGHGGRPPFDFRNSDPERCSVIHGTGSWSWHNAGVCGSSPSFSAATQGGAPLCVIGGR